VTHLLQPVTPVAFSDAGSELVSDKAYGVRAVAFNTPFGVELEVNQPYAVWVF
jgi:hypothetical protein